MLYVADCETDDIDATKIHCLSYREPGDTEEPTVLYDYDEMREFLEEGHWLVIHNGIRFDAKVFRNILGVDVAGRIIDSLPLSWTLFPDRTKHGLELWGETFGVRKPVVTDWRNLSPQEYGHRCSEDVKINERLWLKQKAKLERLYPDRGERQRYVQYLMFKMRMAAVAEETGWTLDVELAERHRTTLTSLVEDDVRELAEVMPAVPEYKLRKKPQAIYRKDGTVSVAGQRWLDLLDTEGLPENHKGDVKELVGHKPPNPQSPVQVKDWLFSLGWEPCHHKHVKDKYGKDKEPIPQVRRQGELTPSILALIEEHPQVQVLGNLSVNQHRLAFFEGLLNTCKDGKVYARVSGLTNTLRFKHAKPLCNIPGVDKPWGKEIRECLIAPEGYVLCGADCVSLEDNTKRHLIYPYDPEFVKSMEIPGWDPHIAILTASGVITEGEEEFYRWYQLKN